MLEGGNEQLTRFFERHSLSPSSNGADVLWGAPNDADGGMVGRRYRTKAAQFYREQLALHVGRVADRGRYMGREESRKGRRRRPPSSGERKSEKTSGGETPSSLGTAGLQPHQRSKSADPSVVGGRRRSRRVPLSDAVARVGVPVADATAVKVA